MLDELVGCVVDWVSALLAVCEAKEKKTALSEEFRSALEGPGRDVSDVGASEMPNNLRD